MWEDERYFVINVGEIYINNAEFIATMEQFCRGYADSRE